MSQEFTGAEYLRQIAKHYEGNFYPPEYTAHAQRLHKIADALTSAPTEQAEPARNCAGETPTEHAHRWATELARSIAKRCYPEASHWEPMPDLLGVITQIDNMTTGMVRATQPERPQEQAEPSIRTRLLDAAVLCAEQLNVSIDRMGKAMEAAQPERLGLCGGDAVEDEFSAANLIAWLEAKYQRHGELEDKAAADLIRYLSRMAGADAVVTEIDLVLSDPDTSLSDGAYRALMYIRGRLDRAAATAGEPKP
jgi:hypothetical protein